MPVNRLPSQYNCSCSPDIFPSEENELLQYYDLLLFHNRVTTAKGDQNSCSVQGLSQQVIQPRNMSSNSEDSTKGFFLIYAKDTFKQQQKKVACEVGVSYNETSKKGCHELQHFPRAQMLAVQMKEILCFMTKPPRWLLLNSY